MKKNFIVFVLLFISVHVQSQHSEKEIEQFKNMSKKIKLDIDETIFKNIEGNTYMSGKPKILFLSAFVIDTYENEKVKMLKFFTQKKFDKKGEMMMADKKVFFIEGSIKKDGIDFLNKNYCINYDDKSVIMITILLEVEADKKYIPMLEKIAHSVAEKN